MGVCCTGPMLRRVLSCKEAPVPGGGEPLPPVWIVTGRTPLGWNQLMQMA